MFKLEEIKKQFPYLCDDAVKIAIELPQAKEINDVEMLYNSLAENGINATLQASKESNKNESSAHIYDMARNIVSNQFKSNFKFINEKTNKIFNKYKDEILNCFLEKIEFDNLQEARQEAFKYAIHSLLDDVEIYFLYQNEEDDLIDNLKDCIVERMGEYIGHKFICNDDEEIITEIFEKELLYNEISNCDLVSEELEKFLKI